MVNRFALCDRYTCGERVMYAIDAQTRELAYIVMVGVRNVLLESVVSRQRWISDVVDDPDQC